MPEDRTVAIDFGTSTTLIASRRGDGPASIEPIGGVTAWMPSLAWVGPDGGFVVGEQAEAMLPHERLIRSVKRQLTSELSTISLDFADGTAQEIPVEDVIRAILERAIAAVRRSAPGYFDGARIHMGCPAMWRGPQRELLAGIAADLGLDVGVADLLDEPIAAGVSWVWDAWQRSGEWPTGNVVVFDYGGGTLDVACLEVHGASSPEITVLAAEGDPRAGDDLDATIAAHLYSSLAAGGTYLQEVELPGAASRSLLIASRRLKEALTTVPERTEALPGYESIIVSLSRGDLDLLFTPQLERALNLVLVTLRAAELRKLRANPSENLRALGWSELAPSIDYVLLAGGLSRIPLVERRLREHFPNASIAVDHSVASPQESVVSGLTFAEAYARLNLHRPAFDIRVRYTDMSTGSSVEETLYSAFEPLYTATQVYLGDTHLGVYRALSLPPEFRGKVDVELLCMSVDHQPIRFALDSDPTSSGRIRFEGRSGNRGHFKLNVDGKVTMHIPGWPDLSFRMENWPIARAANYTVPISVLAESRWDPESFLEAGGWHYNR